MARVVARVDDRELRRIHRRLDRVPDGVVRGAQAAVRESGETIRDRVRRTVGVFRGRLRDRIRVNLKGALGLTADVGWFDRDTYYARFVEFGTSKITANPVLTTAAELERRLFPKRVKKHIEEHL